MASCCSLQQCQRNDEQAGQHTTSGDQEPTSRASRRDEAESAICNLQSDALKIRKYIKRRIKDYPIYVNLGPGEDEDPIALITVGFYAEQGGNLHVVFDTRPKAEVDGEWTVHIDEEFNTLEFPKWADAYDAICEDQVVSVTKHDGTNCKLKDSDGDEFVNAVFGDMLVATMTELRDDGSLTKLPLTPKAIMVIEEFDGRYFWPEYKRRKTLGRILTK